MGARKDMTAADGVYARWSGQWSLGVIEEWMSVAVGHGFGDHSLLGRRGWEENILHRGSSWERQQNSLHIVLI